MNPPKDMSGMECPAIYLLFVSLKRSIRGPNITAPEIRWKRNRKAIKQLIILAYNLKILL